MTRKAILLSLTVLISVLGCGALTVKTWINDAKVEKALVRRKNGVVIERKEYADADAFRCYSRSDDEAIRVRIATLEACCHGAP